MANPLPQPFDSNNPPTPPTHDHSSSLDFPSHIPSPLTECLLNSPPSSPDFQGSPIDLPPTSAFPSETTSAVASDSEIPALPSAKAKQQTGLHDFFQKVPSEQLFASWRKRKRDNEERDKEEYLERKKNEEEEQLRKKARRRKQNQIAQRKRRSKLKKQANAESGDDSSVSPFYIHSC